MISITEKSASKILLEGDLSHIEMGVVKKLLGNRIARNNHSKLEIDLSKVTNVNSIVLSLLLSGLRSAESVSCTLSYTNLPKDLCNMARVGGIEQVLTSSDMTFRSDTI